MGEKSICQLTESKLPSVLIALSQEKGKRAFRYAECSSYGKRPKDRRTGLGRSGKDE
jgi:hypothetical protein